MKFDSERQRLLKIIREEIGSFAWYRFLLVWLLVARGVRLLPYFSVVSRFVEPCMIP